MVLGLFSLHTLVSTNKILYTRKLGVVPEKFLVSCKFTNSIKVTSIYLTPQRGMPSAAHHGVTISWRGVPSGTRLTALSDFSFHLSNTYEAITFCPQQPHR
jgi:hypothetical protein